MDNDMDIDTAALQAERERLRGRLDEIDQLLAGSDESEAGVP